VLDGGDEIAPAFEAFLKGGKRAGQTLAEHRHEKPNTAALVGWEIGQPVEATAELIDAVIQGTLQLRPERDRHVFRMAARQSPDQPALSINPQGRSRGSKHIHRQGRLPGQIGRDGFGLVARHLLQRQGEARGRASHFGDEPLPGERRPVLRHLRLIQLRRAMADGQARHGDDFAARLPIAGEHLKSLEKTLETLKVAPPLPGGLIQAAQ
jgi:hypothetical protein